MYWWSTSRTHSSLNFYGLFLPLSHKYGPAVLQPKLSQLDPQFCRFGQQFYRLDLKFSCGSSCWTEAQRTPSLFSFLTMEIVYYYWVEPKKLRVEQQKLQVQQCNCEYRELSTLNMPEEICYIRWVETQYRTASLSPVNTDSFIHRVFKSIDRKN